jgi:hypothetical protein
MSAEPSLFPAVAERPAVGAPERTELRAALITVPVPGGRALRLARVDDVLVLSDAYAEECPWRGIARGLWVPAEMWPALRAALDELAGE